MRGVPGSGRAYEWPESYLVTVDTPLHPSSNQGVVALGRTGTPCLSGLGGARPAAGLD